MSDSKADSAPQTDYLLLGKRALIVGFALVALFMTVYATSHGAKSFLPETYAWVGITTLAVGFLVFTSFLLGDNITHKRAGIVLFVVPFYLAAVAACWIFSFASYHAQFLSNAGSDLADAERKLGEMAMIPLSLNVDGDAKVREGKSKLAGDPAFGGYLKQVVDLSTQINDPQKKRELQAEVDKLRKLRQDEDRKLRDEALRRKEAADKANGEKKTALDQLTGRVTFLTGKVAEHTKREAELQAAIQIEEFGPEPQPGQTAEPKQEQPGQTAEPKQKTRPGQKAEPKQKGQPGQKAEPKPKGELKADGVAGNLVSHLACKRDRPVGRSDMKDSCFFALESELKSTQTKLKTDQESLRTTRSQVSRAEPDLQQAAAELETATKALERFNAESRQEEELGSGKDLAQRVEELKASPSPGTFDAVALECLTTVAVLKRVAPDRARTECKPQPVLALFAGQQGIETARSQQTKACDYADRTKSIVGSLRTRLQTASGADRGKAVTEAFESLQQALQPCIAAAEKVGVDTARVRGALSAFVDRNNPSQDEISKATGKIWDLFIGTASARDYFPALIAILQELSLLAAKVFWDSASGKAIVRRREDDDLSDLDLTARDGDPLELAAAMSLIRLSDHNRHGLLVPEGYEEGLSAEMRGQMGLQLGILQRQGLAKPARGGLQIGPVGIAKLASIVRRYRPPGGGAPVGPAEHEPPHVKPEPARVVGSLSVVTGGKQKPPAAEKIVAAPSPTPETAEERPDEPSLAPGQRRRPRRPVILRPFD